MKRVVMLVPVWLFRCVLLWPVCWYAIGRDVFFLLSKCMTMALSLFPTYGQGWYWPVGHLWVETTLCCICSHIVVYRLRDIFRCCQFYPWRSGWHVIPLSPFGLAVFDHLANDKLVHWLLEQQFHGYPFPISMTITTPIWGGFTWGTWQTTFGTFPPFLNWSSFICCILSFLYLDNVGFVDQLVALEFKTWFILGNMFLDVTCRTVKDTAGCLTFSSLCNAFVSCRALPVKVVLYLTTFFLSS